MIGDKEKKYYMLYHVRDLDDDGTQEIELIGIYSSMEKCRSAMRRAKGNKRFEKYPRGFDIGTVTLNKVYWEDGFVRTE